MRQAREEQYPLMKTQTISFLSVFVAAIAVPVLVSAAGLSRSLLLNPTAIPKAGMNVDANGIFLNGYDPVAYFTLHKAIKGNPSIKSNFRGAIIQLRIGGQQSRF